MRSYQQRIESSGIADRLSLVAHDSLISFYEKLGFVNEGASQCEFGGGGWFDVVCTFLVLMLFQILAKGKRVYRVRGIKI